jgi:ribosomal protein S18 acetylase RimI-like enzyme
MAVEIASWVLEAGSPYYEWFFGGRERAEAAVAEWVGRPSSEVWAGRATLVLEGEEAVGGYIAVAGRELADCRAADALAAVRAAGRAGGREEVSALRRRLEAAQELFPAPEPDELYLSKMAVFAAWRGTGRGRPLVEEYLAEGRERGFRRFKLDVWAGNRAAVRLYESLGFERVHESPGPEPGLDYVQMAAS